ncbi:MAG: response regulator transcription factor [Clostridia bacterium]|nr:response regulator transcription factor [Clostridia bacterium]
MPKTIYVVDDEKDIREIVRSYLEKEGYAVNEYENGEDALAAFNEQAPDMLVIDIMMPGMSGFELCNEIRKKANTPIIIVSARDEELDRILGIEMGADDYIPKPFSPREMVARVKAVFRRIDGMRSDSAAALTPYCRDLKIYPDERRVVKVTENGEEDLNFTAMEYNFINFMIANKNRVFTRDQLLTNIWEYQYIGDTRAVDDLVKRIRKKLDSHHTDFSIETVWGYGYKVTDSVD